MGVSVHLINLKNFVPDAAGRVTVLRLVMTKGAFVSVLQAKGGVRLVAVWTENPAKNTGQETTRFVPASLSSIGGPGGVVKATDPASRKNWLVDPMGSASVLTLLTTWGVLVRVVQLTDPVRLVAL